MQPAILAPHLGRGQPEPAAKVQLSASSPEGMEGNDQLPRDWSNAFAFARKLLMSVTFDTSHALMSWSNLVALSNVPSIYFTLAVSHALMSWLKAAPWKNIHCIVVTLAVFQQPMERLKAAAP